MIKRAIIAVIGLYKRFVSPLLPNRCRFHPTCSDYTIEALRRHGLLRGGAMAAGRLLRCNPLFKGGPDPVPEARESYLLERDGRGVGDEC
jgi:putative membrane protein insertion efficiency factor